MTVPNWLPRQGVAEHLANQIRMLAYKVELTDLQAPPPIDPPPQTRLLGINMDRVGYYSTELPFNDVLKCARPWRDGSTVVHVDIGDYYPEGVYQCTYEGTGALAWSGAAAPAVDVSPGRQEVLVRPRDAGIRLKVTGSVSNVRLLLPGAGNDGRMWRKGFLDRWDKFQVIRFMDWQRTNHSTLSRWSDRTTMHSETQGSDLGVAVEYMTDLCNRLQADAWFCIPHLADDEFVTEFANLVRRTLRTGLRVYVEHSNEVWNGHFDQSAHCTARGLELGLSTEPNTANALYHAQRTVEIGRIFGNIMDEKMVVRVLGGQTVNTWLTRTMLDHVYDGQPIHEQVDALGIAPYLGAGVDASKTVDDYLREMEANIPALMDRVRLQDHEARPRGVALVAYEGGQGLRATGADQENPRIVATLIATNNDARMHGVYEKYLRAWDLASGGGLMLHFNSTRRHGEHGSWGALEFYDSNEGEAGKYLALVEYAGGG